MSKVIVTAQVEDAASWEEGFRTHGDHFKKMGITGPIDIAISDGNAVALCFEPTDVSRFLTNTDSPENVAAMEHDGVKRDTVRVYVMKKEFRP